ncbi:hypothetical protein WJX73_002769 [Symbiochloris irregularis]|uniref:Protein kinase domain-containing protein n=1 Tax=Symbiochloris irregularis TaxID=706552 RepID=A0AAW1NS89_9CHLO
MQAAQPCYATITDLLPGSDMSMMQEAVAGAAYFNFSLPDPGIGFTLFATPDGDFASSGLRSEASNQIASFGPDANQLDAWLLYNMLPQPYSFEALGQSTQTAPVPDGSSKSGTNVEAIVAGVIGGVVVLCTAIAAAFAVFHRKRLREYLRKRTHSADTSKPQDNMSRRTSSQDGDFKGGWTKEMHIPMAPSGKLTSEMDSAFGMFAEESGDLDSANIPADRGQSADMGNWELNPDDIVICQDHEGNSLVLGEGGFGMVYKATMAGSTPVAVKFVLGQSRKEQERFQLECTILRNLRHGNIVQFLGANLLAGQIMLVTEFMSRGDLWTALSVDHNQMLSWYKRGKGVALDTIRGLQHMHSRKIIHLDLKSSNILLDKACTAKIADVGLAKILSREHTKLSKETTFDWAAPEVLSGGDCNEKADIWSLGVVLWEIWCQTTALRT